MRALTDKPKLIWGEDITKLVARTGFEPATNGLRGLGVLPAEAKGDQFQEGFSESLNFVLSLASLGEITIWQYG